MYISTSWQFTPHSPVHITVPRLLVLVRFILMRRKRLYRVEINRQRSLQIRTIKQAKRKTKGSRDSDLAAD